MACTHTYIFKLHIFTKQANYEQNTVFLRCSVFSTCRALRLVHGGSKIHSAAKVRDVDEGTFQTRVEMVRLVYIYVHASVCVYIYR